MGKETNISNETSDTISLSKRKKDLLVMASSTKSQSLIMGTTDVYKDAVESEEKEAFQRDPENDLQLFCKTSDRFRTLAREVLELKSSNSVQAAAQISEKRIQASLLFVTLKKLNRLEKYRINQSRETLHKAKQQADSCHLQLQNLLYETLHLEKEVVKCLQFKSKDEEIDLVSVEQFYKEAPESVSRKDVTSVDQHQLKLARLEWELRQRKNLAEMCQEMQLQKEKVAAEINKKQSQLDNLNPMLKDIFTVAKPLEGALGLTTGPSPAQQKMALLLPHPLYFLFVQADALREAGEKCITINIEGDEEEVQRMKQTLAEAVIPDDSDSDNQEEGRETAKRHGLRKKSQLEKQEERRKKILMAHPLKVILIISLKGGLGSVSLEFSYLMKLHIVTVKPKLKLSPQVNISPVSSVGKLIDSEHILTELFPEDFGDGSPNTANFYQLKQVGIESFNTSQLGLAYVWAQRVAGLDFAVKGGGEEEVPPSHRVSQLSLPCTVSAIKKRVQARIAICNQIQALESGKLNQIAEVRNHFPQKLIAQLTQWVPITWAQYQALGFTNQMIASCCVSERDLLYKGVLMRGSARLTMAVAIKNCYPLLPPLFVLQAAYENKTIEASNNDSVRDIEREVNVYFKELIGKTKSIHNLLTAQILQLTTNFDILLEASSNQDFPRDKIFIQSNRGRNRAWPFKQLELGDGVFHFTQR